jgi:hypothetical protein
MNAALFVVVATVVGFNAPQAKQDETNGFFGKAKVVQDNKVRITFWVLSIVRMETVAMRNGQEERHMARTFQMQQINVDVGVDEFTTPDGTSVAPRDLSTRLKKKSTVFICVGELPDEACMQSLKDDTLVVVLPDHPILPDKEADARYQELQKRERRLGISPPKLVEPPNED